MIPFSKQTISNKDIQSVINVMKSDFLTQGKKVIEFEKKISKFTKSRFAISSNSGSSSLHLACLSLNLKKNDIVWTVPNTFAASANSALLCGARVDFVDIDPNTWNIDVKQLESKLKNSKKKKKLPKILIPVHFAGQPTDQKKIWQLSRKYNFKIIEDASHSLGARHAKEIVGSCKWSDITVFSFHPTKIITTAEGGMATTNKIDYANRMRMFRTNGIVKDKELLIRKKNFSPWYYEHQAVGHNFRMNEISASLGISQLKRVNKFIKKRNEIANYYKKILKDLPVEIQKIKKENLSSYHLFIIKLNLRFFKHSYKSIFKKLRNKNFFVNLHYMPLHLSPYFRKKGFKENQFPVSENFSKMAISIPIFPNIKKIHIVRFLRLFKSFVK